ncbi:MAG: prepilin-type N-terminal cleavage/methylation domain-containing protein [Pseudomonadota bacterium]
MSTTPCHRFANLIARRSGFTLIELIIVALMVGMLAAVVVPLVSDSEQQADEAALRSTVARVRAAISLYNQQHGEYPARRQSSGGPCPDGLAGKGRRDSPEAFIEQLTEYSTGNGRTCDEPMKSVPNYGPYLQLREFPANPITGSATIEVIARSSATAGDLALTGSQAAGGWLYDPRSGLFIANDTSLDSSDSSFDSY